MTGWIGTRWTISPRYPNNWWLHGQVPRRCAWCMVRPALCPMTSGSALPRRWIVKLSERNQMVLPKAAREVLGIKPGGRVLVVIDGQDVRLLPEPENWSDYIYGLGKSTWEELGGAEQFLREERAAWPE